MGRVGDLEVHRDRGAIAKGVEGDAELLGLSDEDRADLGVRLGIELQCEPALHLTKPRSDRTAHRETTSDVRVAVDLDFEPFDADAESIGDHSHRAVHAGRKRRAEQVSRIGEVVEASDRVVDAVIPGDFWEPSRKDPAMHGIGRARIERPHFLIRERLGWILAIQRAEGVLAAGDEGIWVLHGLLLA